MPTSICKANKYKSKKKQLKAHRKAEGKKYFTFFFIDVKISKFILTVLNGKYADIAKIPYSFIFPSKGEIIYLNSMDFFSSLDTQCKENEIKSPLCIDSFTVIPFIFLQNENCDTLKVLRNTIAIAFY